MNSRKCLRPLAYLNYPAYGVVLRSDTRLGQRIEQRGFTHIWQAHNAALQTHRISFGINPFCTIEPHVGFVALPDPQPTDSGGIFINRTGLCRFSEDFVLVLPKGNWCQLY